MLFHTLYGKSNLAKISKLNGVHKTHLSDNVKIYCQVEFCETLFIWHFVGSIKHIVRAMLTLMYNAKTDVCFQEINGAKYYRAIVTHPIA